MSNGHESPALISAFINCRPCSRSASLLKKSRTTLQGSSLPPATLMEVFSFRVIYVVRMSDKKEPTQAKELLLAVRHLDVGARPLPRQAQLLLSSHAIALACCSTAITACHCFFLLAPLSERCSSDMYGLWSPIHPSIHPSKRRYSFECSQLSIELLESQ